MNTLGNVAQNDTITIMPGTPNATRVKVLKVLRDSGSTMLSVAETHTGLEYQFSGTNNTHVIIHG